MLVWGVSRKKVDGLNVAYKRCKICKKTDSPYASDGICSRCLSRIIGPQRKEQRRAWYKRRKLLKENAGNNTRGNEPSPEKR